MTDYRDKDLFDVWDDGDPIDAKLALLERILDAIIADPEHPDRDFRIAEALRLLAKIDYARRIALLRDALEELADA